ncbi:Beta, beta-carotene 15,15'-dioxygenase [Handroanthus impetiginosus]|uniref:Beta, beta-carotene 15,15'-dioxygenase n=1 Tax=Handroanthus impetiginosus TaxID=429701 RepID=A0A2G9I958_9LAMI|nr:Beta, beta-carotene 15,15'-dioxygenase [Handroanthus impetiginosus]
METLSSSLLPKNTPSLDIPLSRTILNRNPQIKFTANSSFSQPLKKLIKQKFAVQTLTSPRETIVQERKRRTKTSLHEKIYMPLEDLFSRFSRHSSLPQFVDPKQVLSGNFAPVDELPPTACDIVEGSLPLCLDGAYIQNGPNPQFMPRSPFHIADGDGMLHSIKISQGKATFSSRFVRTYKYLLEHELGYPVFPNPVAALAYTKLTAHMVITIARVLTGQLKLLINGFGTANTSLALFGGHLFALIESDLPYAMKITSDGDIITIGRHDLHCRKGFMDMMTAHPKIDPDTGEAFAFRNFAVPPFMTYFRIDSNGRKQKEVPIFSLKRASFSHDFAVTKNFAIFPDTQIVVNPLEVIRGRSMMRVDLHKTPRLGVLPRYAVDESDMYWIDVPGLNVLHVVNAWEEDDGNRIVIMATNLFGIEHALEAIELTQSSMERIVIDVKEKIVTRYPVSNRNLDFGVINPKYGQKKTRYIYAADLEGMPKMAGVVKLDLSLSPADCTVACHMYGPGCYGSEPIFVAREPNNPAADEDDGYLLSYVYNENTQESKFLVMDAKSPTLEIVAAVKLPRRVPHGFHSIFVKESDLQKL